ncbi:MAG: ECF transporter S component [Clostridiaceae bacterium]
MKKTANHLTVRKITTIGMLSSISIILGLTPLGLIPIPPINATTMHIPVIIGAILEGPLVGIMVGLIFGIFSMIRAITAPNLLSFIFINPLVAVLPRVLIGLTTYYTYKLLKIKSEKLRIICAAIIGSLTNTIGVLGLIYLLYLEKYAKVYGISQSAARKGILTVALINGLPEAIICSAFTLVIVLAIRRSIK